MSDNFLASVDPHKVRGEDKPRVKIPPEERHVSAEQKLRIIEGGGSNWVVSTEVRVKYEVLELRHGQLEPTTYEVYFDPGVFDGFMFQPFVCDGVREKASDLNKNKDNLKHMGLLPDGSGPGWEALLRAAPDKIFQPRPSSPGRFRSAHTPFCFHRDSCDSYCICLP